MIADIGYPDFETRLAILKAKSQEVSHLIGDDVLKYIAETISRNIRELEGALNRVIVHARLKNGMITIDEVKKILSLILNKTNQYIPPKEVIKKIASFYDLSESEILGHSKKKELVKPRQIVMYLLREEFKYSYTNIAEKIGNRDHTTIIHAYKKINKEIEENPVFAQEVNILKEMIYNK